MNPKSVLLALPLACALGCSRHDAAVQNQVGAGAAPSAAAQEVRSGQERGNGIDFESADARSAWFLRSDRAIRFCYRYASDFGAGPARIEAALKAGFAKWAAYFDAKKIDEGPGPKATRTSELMANCDGSEDVRFDLGVGQGGFSSASPVLRQQIAGAYQTQPNHAHGWSPGVIWVASHKAFRAPAPWRTAWGRQEEVAFPDWTNESSLEGTILHEIGHVFGAADVSGTIMDPHLVHDYTSQPAPWATSHLKEIDFLQELVVCRSCDGRWNGSLGDAKPIDWSPSLAAENFRWLMNRPPQGEMRAFVEGSHERGYRLVAEDVIGSAVFQIEPDPSKSPESFGGSTVIVLSQDPEFTAGMTGTFAVGSSRLRVYARIRNAAGETAPVYLERNGQARWSDERGRIEIMSALVIHFFGDQDSRLLFWEDRYPFR